MKISNEDFQNLYTYVKANFGVNLEKKRTLVEGRLSNFIIQQGFEGFSDYLKDVFDDRTGAKLNTLMTKLTTNYTYFMREEQHYKFMESVALPELTSRIKDKDLRIWSAGCASGEEAYTTVMVLHEWFGAKISSWDTKLLATDISTRVLDMAKEGVYPKEHFDKLSKAWTNKYFDKIDSDKYKIKPILRNSVHFGQFNLMGPFNKFRKRFHIIFCRNVMIYFDSPTKKEIARKFHDSLEIGGYLFIGHSETLGGIQGNFRQIKPAIYQRVM